MALLDELSGYEFEDLMEDVFRRLGYQHVRQSSRTADEGRDILMEEVVDDEPRAVIVECKHTDTVSRPVVQKLHSAVATYDFDGPKRGMVVTTGRFTDPAREYAESLGTRTDGGIELLDGTDLREIGEAIGMDLYNGRIEILCEETLEPVHPTESRSAPLLETVGEVETLEPEAIPDPETALALEPTVTVSARTSATFETSVGVIHSIDERNDLVVHADRDGPRVASGALQRFVASPSAPRVDLEAADLEAEFDALERERFDRTETEYREWAVDKLRAIHTTTVHYTGKNNVDYEKTCTPNESDVLVQAIDPVYVPHVRSTLSLGQYEYAYDYYAAGPSRATTRNDLQACVHCDAAGGDRTYTYCDNCGSINCDSHVRTERLEGEPVCTGCAVTERFALKTKYFYDEANLEAFRAEYDEMAIHEKVLENRALAAGIGVVLALAAVLFVLVLLGGVLALL